MIKVIGRKARIKYKLQKLTGEINRKIIVIRRSKHQTLTIKKGEKRTSKFEILQLFKLNYRQILNLSLNNKE